jgi:hypothetical protein
VPDAPRNTAPAHVGVQDAWNALTVSAFHTGIAPAKRFLMDPQDQELLDKQLRNLHVPPRRDGIVIATIVAVFLGGIIIGGALAKPREPAPSAANPQIASALIGAPSTSQQ